MMGTYKAAPSISVVGGKPDRHLCTCMCASGALLLPTHEQAVDMGTCQGRFNDCCFLGQLMVWGKGKGQHEEDRRAA